MTPAIERFDAVADAGLEHLRGRVRAADRTFQLASTYGDFSAIWHVAGAIRALAGWSNHDWRNAKQAVVLSAFLGVESLIVNQGLKRLFRRVRPTETGDPRFHVRRPSTSSFPSGHASSAFFAATVLTGWDGWRWAPLWFGLAVIVALSRAWVRIHHVSDVIAGAIVGTALGLLARLVIVRAGW